MAFEAKELFDSLGPFPDGVNSGIAALSVPRTQLASAINTTVRGTFARTRPAFRKMTLGYSDSSLQANAETQLFQGATYFKPDFGQECLVAQIGGRLFQFQISGTSATVSDVSIAADLNSATNPLAFLWQSEKWVVCNDGLHLPLFFDAVSSRRSVGPAANINTIGVTFTAPAIGSTVSVTMGSTFSGPFNVPLQISTGASSSTKYRFMAVGTNSSFNGYPVTLKNLSETSGAVEASASQVTALNNIVGIVATSVTVPAFQHLGPLTIALTAPPTVPVGTVVTIQLHSTSGVINQNGTITAISGNNITLSFSPSQLQYSQAETVQAGDSVTAASGGSSTLVALLNQSFTAPAQNATGTAYFDRAYTGAIPQTVYINSKQFQVTAVTPPVASTTVILSNLDAPTTASLFASGGIVYTIGELPVGRMGVNGLARNWMCLQDGKSFVAGDVVGNTTSGSSAYSYRDSSLKITENTYLNGGGTFVVPGQAGEIRAMIFPAKLDASLGQGSLMVYTPDVAFSCNTPVERASWQDVTNPILTESMKGGGAEAHDSTINANSDVISRDNKGLRSLILARRDYNTWGNTPISREVQPTLAEDDKSLLVFGSAIEFDNRALYTANPQQSVVGVYHDTLVALNFDPVSSLRGKAPSVYDGVWEGLNVLRLVKGSFLGKERAFAFCASSDLTRIELWEILPSDGPDSDTDDNNGTPIVLDIVSGAINFNQDPRKRDLLRLLDGEIFVDSVVSEVTYQAYYKPDQWPAWVPWYSWRESFDANTDPGFRPRMGLGEPDPTKADTSNERPLREGYTFQLRVVITGQCRFLGARFKAVTVPQTQFANPSPNTV